MIKKGSLCLEQTRKREQDGREYCDHELFSWLCSSQSGALITAFLFVSHHPVFSLITCLIYTVACLRPSGLQTNKKQPTHDTATANLETTKTKRSFELGVMLAVFDFAQ